MNSRGLTKETLAIYASRNCFGLTCNEHNRICRETKLAQILTFKVQIDRFHNVRGQFIESVTLSHYRKV